MSSDDYFTKNCICCADLTLLNKCPVHGKLEVEKIKKSPKKKKKKTKRVK